MKVAAAAVLERLVVACRDIHGYGFMAVSFPSLPTVTSDHCSPAVPLVCRLIQDCAANALDVLPDATKAGLHAWRSQTHTALGALRECARCCSELCPMGEHEHVDRSKDWLKAVDLVLHYTALVAVPAKLDVADVAAFASQIVARGLDSGGVRCLFGTTFAADAALESHNDPSDWLRLRQHCFVQSVVAGEWLLYTNIDGGLNAPLVQQALQLCRRTTADGNPLSLPSKPRHMQWLLCCCALLSCTMTVTERTLPCVSC